MHGTRGEYQLLVEYDHIFLTLNQRGVNGDSSRSVIALLISLDIRRQVATQWTCTWAKMKVALMDSSYTPYQRFYIQTVISNWGKLSFCCDIAVVSTVQIFKWPINKCIAWKILNKVIHSAKNEAALCLQQRF